MWYKLPNFTLETGLILGGHLPSTFNFNASSAKSPHPPQSDPFNLFLAAANGQSLPGRWGLLQNLLNLWTSGWPMPGAGYIQWTMWSLRSGVNTIGAFKGYSDSLKGPQARVVINPGIAFQIANNLVHPDLFNQLNHLTYSACKERTKPEDSLLQEDDQKVWIRKFQVASDVATYFFFCEDPVTADVTSGIFTGSGPFIKAGSEVRFQQVIADFIWQKNDKECDLELTANKDQYRNFQFKLNSIGPPDDYVNSGAAGPIDIERIASRCRTYQTKGLTRRIMLHGPPGCGKSTFARNIAGLIGVGRTLRVDPEALSYAGAGIFATFLKLLKPQVVLFDDLDRADEGASMLHYIEDARDEEWAKKMIIMATVNAINTLDPAMLRSGRFDEVHIVEAPCNEQRLFIVQHYLKKFSLAYDAQKLSDLMPGWSPAEVREVICAVSIVGIQHLQDELGRVGLQRTYYADDAVAEYIMSHRNSPKG